MNLPRRRTPQMRATLQLAIECRLRVTRNELWQAYLSGEDAAANDGPAQRAHDVLDLRQLGHARECGMPRRRSQSGKYASKMF